ncbi:S-layer homology domain-containing protein [Ructibacterium gallinarum]|uniref:S-layer homology domain-containing protein n=1 Tax=Ructibacterium gallinarum TaxID=2779355 RepID=A0A9D5M1R5_9FIRM|nr:S-layer homology domain-containing protein [Ructibacterium gallinarum]MBE5038990.1 S-layer homology domain-containing protein [Ructibacterium gallinarum]
MMKRKIGICLLLCLLWAVSALAAEPVCKVDIETGEISVSGVTEQAKKNRNVTIRVYDGQNGVAHVDQIKTTENGAYSFVFTLINAGGDYRGVISAQEEKDQSFSFYLPNTQETEAFLNAVIACVQEEDAAKLAQVLEQYENAAGLQDTAYADLNKTPVAKALLEKAKADPSVTEGIKQLQAALKEIAVVEAFNQRKTVMENGVFLHEDILKLSEKEEAYALFADGIKAGAKQALAESMQGKNFADIADLQADFEKQTAVFAVGYYKNNGYGHVRGILEKYAALLDLDLTAYGRLSDTQKNTVDAKLVKAAPTTPETLRSALKTAVSEVSAQGGGTGGSGTGGGGGGGRPSGIGGGTTGIYEIDQNDIDAMEQEQNQPVFSDLTDYPWAQVQIVSLAKRGILNGTGDGKFEPERPVCREEFVKMLIAGFGLSVEGEATFADVEPDAWYAAYVGAGVKHGLVYGISDTEFGVGQWIRREDAAVLIYRAMQNQALEMEQTQVHSFVDQESISGYAAEAVGVLSGASILQGNDQGYFLPDASLTRAEAAVMLYRVLEGRES